jgi:hypothetical protein
VASKANDRNQSDGTLLPSSGYKTVSPWSLELERDYRTIPLDLAVVFTDISGS